MGRTSGSRCQSSYFHGETHDCGCPRGSKTTCCSRSFETRNFSNCIQLYCNELQQLHRLLPTNNWTVNWQFGLGMSWPAISASPRKSRGKVFMVTLGKIDPLIYPDDGSLNSFHASWCILHLLPVYHLIAWSAQLFGTVEVEFNFGPVMPRNHSANFSKQALKAQEYVRHGRIGDVEHVTCHSMTMALNYDNVGLGQHVKIIGLVCAFCSSTSVFHRSQIIALSHVSHLFFPPL